MTNAYPSRLDAATLAWQDGGVAAAGIDRLQIPPLTVRPSALGRICDLVRRPGAEPCKPSEAGIEPGPQPNARPRLGVVVCGVAKTSPGANHPVQ